MARSPRLVGAALLVLAAAPGLAATLLYLRANGLTFAGLGLGAAVLLWLSLAAALLPRARRGALVVAGVSAVLGVAFVATRLARPAGRPPLEVCLDDRCGASPWWARVPPEHEAARAGLYLSGLLGAMRGAELEAFERLLDVEYAKLAGGPWEALPNALLLSSGRGAVWSHRWVPPGSGPRPCLVFLHGFGGQLTPYLRALVQSELGRDFVLVAPTLDPGGAWWTPRGAAVVERVLDQLPPEADRQRVYLVGLSNGSVGAVRLATASPLRGRLRGAVLVSGLGEAGGAVSGVRLLVISGTRDPRFRWPWVKELAAQLEAEGAELTLEGYDADHFLLLTHAAQWTHRAHEWVTADAAR